MAKQNGFEIAPYFERQGLAAQGAADEWMDYARKTADQHLKTLDPNVRNRVAPQLTNYLSENYQRLKLFEAREVRRGKLQKLETDVERRIGALASSMSMEADSTARNDALNMADVENAYAADSRRIAAIVDENERAREQSAADERRKVQTEAIAQSRAEREEAGFARMMRDIQDGEKLLDDAVAEGVMDDETARVRKLQASGAAISGTIAALADKGHFDLAEGFVSRLERPGGEGLPSVGLAYGVYPDSIARLRDRIRIGRNRVEAERAAREREEISSLTVASANARAKGTLDELEGALGDMRRRATAAVGGSRLQTVALQEVSRLDRAAEAEATREAWDGILEAAQFEGAEYIPPKGSRMERLYPSLKKSFDRQLAEYAADTSLAADRTADEVRRSVEAALRMRMMEAAKMEPGAFSAILAGAASDGSISISQYVKLRDEFRDTWRREGMADKANTLVRVLRNEFFSDRDYDLTERIQIDPKRRRFEFAKDPETKQPFEGEDIEYKSKDDGFWSKSKLSAADQLQLLDWAIELAEHDGELISTDPMTGGRLEKPRRLDAVEEFQRVCSNLKREKAVAAAQRFMDERADVQLTMREAFAVADRAVVEGAEKAEGARLAARAEARQAKRRPFEPKMPGVARATTEDNDTTGEE